MGTTGGRLIPRPSAACCGPPAMKICRARRSASARREGRFSLCQRILEEGHWPWELIDVEPLLDDRATILHYLGPHKVDAASLRTRFRVELDMDIVLEPVGADIEPEFSEETSHAGSGDSCASCDCGEEGGCGKASVASQSPASHRHGSIKAETAWRTFGAFRLLVVRHWAAAGRPASTDSVRNHRRPSVKTTGGRLFAS